MNDISVALRLAAFAAGALLMVAGAPATAAPDDAPAVASVAECPPLADGRIVACPELGTARIVSHDTEGAGSDTSASGRFEAEAGIAQPSSIAGRDGPFRLRYEDPTGSTLVIDGVMATGTFMDDERFGLRMERTGTGQDRADIITDDGSHCTFEIDSVALGAVEGSFRCDPLPRLEGDGTMDLSGSFSASVDVGLTEAVAGGTTFFEAPLTSVSAELPGGPMTLTYVNEHSNSLEIIGLTSVGTFDERDGFSLRLLMHGLGRHIIDSTRGGCSITLTRAAPDRIEGSYECAEVSSEGLPPISGTFSAVPIGASIADAAERS